MPIPFLDILLTHQLWHEIGGKLLLSCILSFILYLPLMSLTFCGLWRLLGHPALAVLSLLAFHIYLRIKLPSPIHRFADGSLHYISGNIAHHQLKLLGIFAILTAAVWLLVWAQRRYLSR